MMGIPPAQLASKAMHRPFSRATRYSSPPCTRQQGLVGRDHVFARPEHLELNVLGDARAADQLDADADARDRRGAGSGRWSAPRSGSCTGRGLCVSTSTTQASSSRTPILAAMASPSSRSAWPRRCRPSQTRPTQLVPAFRPQDHLSDAENSRLPINNIAGQVKEKPQNPATKGEFRPAAHNEMGGCVQRQRKTSPCLYA